MERIFNVTGILETAQWCWEQAGGAKIIALRGPMGAGKTTLVHAMCDVKSVKDPVSSPTFSIINEYNYAETGHLHTIYHIDLYRLNDEEEAIRAGVEDCLYSGNTCLVEWPEKAPGLFPADTIYFSLEVKDTDSRKLIISRN